MAAGATYEPIQTYTLGSAQSSITFSSIAASWTDLRLVIVGKATTSNTHIYVRFNSDSGTNYSTTLLYGTGTAAGSTRITSQNIIDYNFALGYFDTNIALATMDIFSYAGPTYKTCLMTNQQDKNGSGEIDYYVSLWRSTAAITAVNLSSLSFAAGTTATLYGIKAA